jgi:voltage-gated potassium channel
MKLGLNRQTLHYAADATLALAAVVTIVVSAAKAQGVTDPVVFVADWVAWVVFVAYFFLGLILTKSPARYARENLIVLVAIVVSLPVLPSQAALLELARLAVLVPLLYKYWRGFRGLTAALSRRGFIYVAVLNVVLVIGGATMLWVLEPETLPNGIGEGIYWAVITIATVGYGDIVPHTPAGRMLAVVMVLGGVGLLATLTASVAAYFVSRPASSLPAQAASQPGTSDLQEITRQLDRIEARQEELARKLESRQDSSQPE